MSDCLSVWPHCTVFQVSQVEANKTLLVYYSRSPMLPGVWLPSPAQQLLHWVWAPSWQTPGPWWWNKMMIIWRLSSPDPGPGQQPGEGGAKERPKVGDWAQPGGRPCAQLSSDTRPRQIHYILILSLSLTLSYTYLSCMCVSVSVIPTHKAFVTYWAKLY